jgi:signal transduction protein with GAF and PtsI domain
MWTCHSLLFEHVQMTTNSIEAWHNALNRQFASEHVNIWELIRGLMKDEIIARQLTLAEQAGASLPSSSQSVNTKHQRMINLLQRYQEGRLGLLDLIREISRNLSY